MRVLLVDDHPIVIAACQALLADEAEITVTAAVDAASGLASFAADAPEVCVLDINLPSVSGLELAQQILGKDAEARIVIFSINDDPVFIARAVDIGVKGYVSKSGDPNDLVIAIREVGRGGTFLPTRNDATAAESPIVESRLAQIGSRETKILRLLATGRTLAEIAKLIGVSYGTVANDTAIMRHKLGVRSTRELVRLAAEISAKLLS
ncbi:response regulator transcription factor [Bradyrhizobium tropiciagri]|uniref:response regulator transcription factor n=1 Tax=Bradyrhizobium tropiciagri TaxID=312253 RepID=UPI001BAC36A4|nr:response regulator transcription factor [Bradyrhizobium tropiciagri]MBR0897359.1 response regulator transcription factor [Bradyrhizobium tropiciagri]